LLITFFVFTTTMSQATAMNMNEPKDDPNNLLKVKNSGVMTLLLGKSDQVYYYMGELVDPNKQFKSSNFKDIRQVILDKKNATPIGDLMYIIKADKQATFKNAINILDEMSINAVPPGHYAEVDMSDVESQLIKSTEAANGIK
jgi:biopolymer transport protein ExbD